ncbi:MAG: hypothetical protein AVDCRST_MAG50-2707, partial [uncultured Acidimicrobiales bacterium]
APRAGSRSRSVGLLAPPRGVGAHRLAGRRLLVRHDAHRPPGHPRRRGGGDPQPGRVVRSGPADPVGRVGLAGARHRRAVPVQRAHEPAPPAELRRATAVPARHADVARTAGRRLGAGLRRAEARGPARPRHAGLQRRGGVQPLAGRRQRLRLQPRAALPRPRGGGAHRPPDVAAGGRAAAGAALLAARADDLPVPPVDHPDRAGRLADVRRRRRLRQLRHPVPAVRAQRHPRPADRRHADEGPRRRVPVDGHRRAVHPLRHQGRRGRPGAGQGARPQGPCRRRSRRRGPHLGAGGAGAGPGGPGT